MATRVRDVPLEGCVLRYLLDLTVTLPKKMATDFYAQALLDLDEPRDLEAFNSISLVYARKLAEGILGHLFYLKV